MTTTIPHLSTATAALLALMLLSGCGRSKTAPQTGTPPGAVAQVGDRIITADQLERKLAEQSRRRSAPLGCGSRNRSR